MRFTVLLPVRGRFDRWQHSARAYLRSTGNRLEVPFTPMTESQILLVAAIVAGFLLLALTVGAFVIDRQRFGVLLLVLSGAAFVVALVFMGRVSVQWEDDKRDLVLAKYDVTVQAWGAPLGSAPVWKVDGRESECVVTFDSPDDPVLECDGEELPKR